MQRCKTRIFALLLCLCFLAAVFFPCIYLSAHANHTHDHAGPGGDCAVCVCVAAARTLIKTMGAVFACAVFALGFGCTLPVCLRLFAGSAGFFSPVARKVRLNS